jgi:hypothetical protein
MQCSRSRQRSRFLSHPATFRRRSERLHPTRMSSRGDSRESNAQRTTLKPMSTPPTHLSARECPHRNGPLSIGGRSAWWTGDFGGGRRVRGVYLAHGGGVGIAATQLSRGFTSCDCPPAHAVNGSCTSCNRIASRPSDGMGPKGLSNSPCSSSSSTCAPQCSQ